MDVIFVFSVIFVTLGINQAHATLTCLECTHICFNREHTFKGAEDVYKILKSKQNPACASQDPSKITSDNDVGKIICPALSDSNRCSYVSGKLDVQLPSYGNATMSIGMHVRNCESAVSQDIANIKCYNHDTTNTRIRSVFQNELTNVLTDVKVVSFDALQCYCNTDLCATTRPSGSTTLCASGTSGSTIVVASTVTMVITSILYLIIAT